MNWLILEEAHVENFWPLSRTRATWELRFGAWTPLERALLETPNVALRVRKELAPYARAKTGLPVNEDIEARQIEGETRHGLPAAWPWQILGQSDKLIAADFDKWAKNHRNHRDTALMSGAHIVGDRNHVHIGEGSVVQPGCVLDATNGPIILAERVQVKWSQIVGPVFIGHDGTLDGARVRPGVSVGHGCKLGGEISASIFQSRVNKAHEGFVGNSWAGRWVNFGALATTSNLKNTYGEIRFSRDGQNSIDTGVQFLGSLIGDHTKIGIGQMLTTGSHIGVASNIFGGGVAPKYVPSFCWGGLAGWDEYRLDNCLKTVRATLGRRHAELRPESESVLRSVWAQTADDRALFLNR